jgi:hypothetical protein
MKRCQAFICLAGEGRDQVHLMLPGQKIADPVYSSG